MREYQTSDTFKLPDITTSMTPKDMLDISLDKQTHTKKLIIPMMKIFAEDSPVLDYNGKDFFKQNRQQSRSDEVVELKHDKTEGTLTSLQSHFNYEHFTGSAKRNIPCQPELIRLLTETELGRKEPRHKSVNPESAEGMKDKKMRCEHCRMPNGKHKHWCITYLENQKAKDNVIFADRGSIKTKRKRVSFGDVSYRAVDANETDRKVRNKFRAGNKIPQMIRSSTTLDGLNLRPDRPDLSSLHRDVYIQALAESRARRVMKMKSAYNFSTQTTRPFLFSYFDNLNGQSCRRRKCFDGMKNIFGDVDVDKYYERLTGKTRKGFYSKP